MRILMSLAILLTSMVALADESCTVTVSKTEDKVLWSSPQAKGKFLIINNLDTKLLYPQMILSTTSGSLPLKNLDANKKGYQILLVDITPDSKNLIDSHLKSCFAKKDCSMQAKDIRVKKTKCGTIKSDVLTVSK